jgi:putative two-component system response regulator
MDGTTHTLDPMEVEFANRLALVAEYRDYPDGAHVQRVGRLASLLASHMGLPEDQIAIIRYAAPLHDIGKIALPDSILLKPAPLTLDELDVMKAHTTIGARMLTGSPSRILQMAEEIALYHHENWDGTGYTPGMRGERIPLPGRIAAVADVFDALTHERPYKRPWTIDETVSWMDSVRSRKFDPAVVDALLRSLDAIRGRILDRDDDGSGDDVPSLPLLEPTPEPVYTPLPEIGASTR